MPDVARDRGRLIDHFKDVHTIIAGVAITDACTKLFPFALDYFGGARLWMFFTFFITIVPILHGSSRSLDVKYIDESPRTPLERIKYIWDFYMLLITAIFFVAVALALPNRQDIIDYEASTHISYSPAAVFYYWLSATLVFDVVILMLDFTTSYVVQRKISKTSRICEQLRPYLPWIIMNGLLAIICFITGRLIGSNIIGMVPIGSCSVPLWALSAGIFALAFARTAGDYIFGGRFMFPS